MNADSSVSLTWMRERDLKGERDGAKRDGREQRQSHGRWCGTEKMSGATEAVGNGAPAFGDVENKTFVMQNVWLPGLCGSAGKRRDLQ
jgi:hypothetical protein